MINKIYFENKLLKSIDTKILGYSGENKQQILEFSFDNFIDGIANLELILPNKPKGFIELNKDIDNKIYSIEVKSSLLANMGEVSMQISIIKDNIEVYKTEMFKMFVAESINATESIEEQYPTFVEVTNSRLLALENGKQDKLIAGDNITIVNNVISSTGGGTGAVASVNGKTGTVVLNATDVGALPDNTPIPSIEGLASEMYVDNKIADINIPTKVSELQNDSGFLTEEQDPTVPSYVKSITEIDITNWNNKSDFSGNYEDLSNKPTIPSIEGLASETWVNEQGFLKEHQDISGKQDKLTAGENINIENNVISATGGSTITIDTSMSNTSENAVQNKVIKEYIDNTVGNIESLLAEV